MNIIRLYHKKYADLFGYFWLPCPICGEMMGGHEWKEGSIQVLQDEHAGKCCCTSCVKKYGIDENQRIIGFVYDKRKKKAIKSNEANDISRRCSQI